MSERYEKLMQRMAGNWPVDEDKLAVKLREFHSIYEGNGNKRFAECVQNCIHQSQLRFFPTVGEFLGFMPKRDHAFWRDSNCECKGTGFVDAGQDADNNRQMRRCGNPECVHMTV